jgi:hypothetical protein
MDQADRALTVLLWLAGLVLAGVFYVAVVLIADRAGKILKMLIEIRDQLAATQSLGATGSNQQLRTKNQGRLL